MTVKSFARRVLPPQVRSALKRLSQWDKPATGKVDFGDFGQVRPISPHFGYDRGAPVDRHYIEGFLRKNAADLKGRTLEIGSDDYCRMFGAGITRQDVLHVDETAVGATIIGDLSRPGTLSPGTFDCQVVTQTLHLIYDVKAAVQELHDGLAPGGVLLATVPGVATVCRDEFRDIWYWSMTRHSVLKIFGEVFGETNLQIETFGNVYAAVSFLEGLAVEDVDASRLDVKDESYPMIIGVRAAKAG
ncbi:methyltransferase domain-containing protein [Tsuneonella sp. HG222]